MGVQIVVVLLARHRNQLISIKTPNYRGKAFYAHSMLNNAAMPAASNLAAIYDIYKYIYPFRSKREWPASNQNTSIAMTPFISIVPRTRVRPIRPAIWYASKARARVVAPVAPCDPARGPKMISIAPVSQQHTRN